jgi:Tfp pilus assembly protein PilZ
MTQPIWYIYQNEQQLGPFTDAQISQLHSNKMVADSAYIFKSGWEEWKPIKDGLKMLGIGDSASSEKESELGDERRDSRRASISGRIIVHNRGDMTYAEGINISENGLFFETQQEVFKMGEEVKVTIQVREFTRPYNARGVVTRHNSDPDWLIGYGIRFEALDPRLRDEIKLLCMREDDDLPVSTVSKIGL